MTTAAQTAAALPAQPVVQAPGQSLDLSPATAAANQSQMQAAAAAATRWTGKLSVGGKREFDLVPVLTPLDMILLQEAQESGQLRQIIETVPLMVLPEQQAEMREWLLSNPADVADRVSFDDVINAMNNGMEQINARP